MTTNADDQTEEQVESVEEPQVDASQTEETIEEPEVLEESTSAEAAAKEAEVKKEEEPIRLQLLRLQADFDNFRKRTRKEKEEWTQRSVERVMEDLLTVLDHYELGMKNAEQNDVQEGVMQGFKMVQDQLTSSLGKYGLKPVDAEGEAFDPNLHEAVTHMASPDVEADHVMAQTRRGYMLGDRLLRPAQVVVSSGAPDEEQSDVG